MCALRATAKKFLAAANFLEVLSVFTPTSDVPTTTINVPEKIRYAKWKAADIAKAFREGRKPVPGGADEASTADEAAPAATSTDLSISPSTVMPPPTSIHPSSPPEPHNMTSSMSPSQSYIGVPPQGFVDSKDTPMSPSAWSTAVTPGTPGDTGDTSIAFGPSENKSSLRKAWVSDELEGQADEGDHWGNGDDEGIQSRAGLSSTSYCSKSVHFTPSVTGGLTPSTAQPEDDPFGSLPTPVHFPETDPAYSPEFAPSVPVFNPEVPAPPHSDLQLGSIPRSALQSSAFPPIHPHLHSISHQIIMTGMLPVSAFPDSCAASVRFASDPAQGDLSTDLGWIRTLRTVGFMEEPTR